jgi:hypothetical protein
MSELPDMAAYVEALRQRILGKARDRFRTTSVPDVRPEGGYSPTGPCHDYEDDWPSNHR